MSTTLAEMPFHAKLAGNKLSESPLGKIIFEHEAQVVADHDAGRITDAEFDAFYQKASDSLSRLYDLNHRSVEEDKEFKEVTAEADTQLEALAREKLGAETFRIAEETYKVGLEAASEKNAATLELQHGWANAARDLIDLRSSFENADAAALDRDRTLVAEREQYFDATDARYTEKIATEVGKIDRNLTQVEKLAEFERRDAELEEKAKEATQELASFDRRIEEIKAEKAGIDARDPDAPQALAEVDQRLDDTRAERFEFSRASHETLDVEALHQLEAHNDYLITLAKPMLESSLADVRDSTRRDLNADLADTAKRLAELQDDMAERAKVNAEHDAAIARIAELTTQIEANKEKLEANNERLEANNARLDAIDPAVEAKSARTEAIDAHVARFEQYRDSNNQLKQEIESVHNELTQQLKEQAAENEARTAETALKLVTKLTDSSAEVGAEPPKPDQASVDRQANIDRLESTVTELREKLLDQMDAQVREHEAFKLKLEQESQADAARGGADAAAAQANAGGASSDSGGHGGANEPATVIDAEFYHDAEHLEVADQDIEASIVQVSADDDAESANLA